MGFATVETLLDDVSRQMASSNLTKYSKGSTGQRAGAGSMRVVKPNSTSSSPRGSIGLGRRRTVMTDRRMIALADQSMATPAGFISNNGLQIPTRLNRPVSWHSSSQITPHPQYRSAYQVPIVQAQPDFHIFDLPPTTAIYSGYGSPDSPFSPLSMPYAGYEQHYPYAHNSVPYYSSQGYPSSQPATQTAIPYCPTQSGDADSSIYSHFDWSNFATNGFESSTAPPTPENFLPIQHTQTTLPADDSIPYHSLSDSEPEGEILQGLGLYDTPDVPKSLSTAPQFDDYRALVMSQLLGPAFRKPELESMGKGLKLEETWNPPASDDEDDDEDDDEQDGEAEDDEEPTTHTVASTSIVKDGFRDAANCLPTKVLANHGIQPYSGNTWL